MSDELLEFHKSLDVINESIATKDVDTILKRMEFLKTKRDTLLPLLKNNGGLDAKRYDELLVQIFTILTMMDPKNAMHYSSSAKDIDPNNLVTLNNLAYLYHREKKDFQKSIETYLKILNMDPTFMPAYLGACELLHSTKTYDVEIQILKLGLRHYPESTDLWNQLGVTLVHSNLWESLSEPLTALNMALQHAKTNVEKAKVLVNLGHLFCSLGEVSLSMAKYLQAASLDPTVRIAYQNFLLNLHYIDPNDEDMFKKMNEISSVPLFPNQTLKEAYLSGWESPHKAFASVMYADVLYDCNTVKVKDHKNDKLHIAYISSDFVGHVVGMYIEGLFKNHDRSKFKVYAYSNVLLTDEVIKTISCDEYRCITSLNTRDACELIQNDKIDILIDLGGYTSMNRVDIMSLPVAKHMYTYLGYPNGLGMSHVKRISDTVSENRPAGIYNDMIVLPQCFLTFEPLVPMGKTAQTHDIIVFGCFAKLAKITPRLARMWTQILQALPYARLVIKSKFFADISFARSWFDSKFPKSLLSQISLIPGGKNYPDHVNQFNIIDIHLDTFPYSGTTITTEALFYGIPVITYCPDDAPHVSRVSGSILQCLGLESDLVARTEEDYVEKAITLAKNLKVGVSIDVRKHLSTSSLANPQQLVPIFENYLLQDTSV